MMKQEKKRCEERIKFNEELVEMLNCALVDAKYFSEELRRYGCLNEVREEILENIRNNTWQVSERLQEEKQCISLRLWELQLNNKM